MIATWTPSDFLLALWTTPCKNFVHGEIIHIFRYDASASQKTQSEHDISGKGVECESHFRHRLVQTCKKMHVCPCFYSTMDGLKKNAIPELPGLTDFGAHSPSSLVALTHRLACQNNKRNDFFTSSCSPNAGSESVFDSDLMHVHSFRLL